MIRFTTGNPNRGKAPGQVQSSLVIMATWQDGWVTLTNFSWCKHTSSSLNYFFLSSKRAMGLCKCPKKKVTNQFCFEHRVNVCEHCLVSNHPRVRGVFIFNIVECFPHRNECLLFIVSWNILSCSPSCPYLHLLLWSYVMLNCLQM